MSFGEDKADRRTFFCPADQYGGERIEVPGEYGGGVEVNVFVHQPLSCPLGFAS